jgi:ribose transport system ATP-binding protein
MTTPVLELEQVTKCFGPTPALRGVSLDVLPGEIHVLAGENGAGKTTLIRILSGAITDHTGSVRLDGRPLRLQSPSDALRAGIATIHQELSLVGSLAVADNLALAGAGSWRGRRAAAQRALALLDLDLDPDLPVEVLPLAQQQLCEIARALSQKARMLVLDEPTSALGGAEAARLFERLDGLRAQGVGMVYISHRLEEIYRVADRITVLRDGQVVTTRAASDLGPDALVSAMVGRELATVRAGEGCVEEETAFSLDGVHAVRRGEIVGLFGLQGSGTSDLLRGRFDPRRSIAQGVVLLPGDRHASVFFDLSVLQNATLSSLARYCRGGWVIGAAERRAVEAQVARLRLATPSLDAPASQLSGGNQQKVALARCLLCEPRVLLLDEPTRGIDVGAKADVHALLRDLARRGVAIVLSSTELEELAELCDRVLVLAQGRVVADVSRADFSRERILALAMEAA